jgi:hypothetical protein
LKTNSGSPAARFRARWRGRAYLPTMVAAPDLLERHLVRVLPDYAAPPLWMSAVYPASHRSTAKVKLFLDSCAPASPVEPQWDRALGYLRSNRLQAKTPEGRRVDCGGAASGFSKPDRHVRRFQNVAGIPHTLSRDYHSLKSPTRIVGPQRTQRSQRKAENKKTGDE